MSSENHPHGTSSNNGNSNRGICLSAKSWTHLDEDSPAPKAAVDVPFSSMHLVDRAEENICNWLDSGFYLSASHDSQENRDKAALSPPPEMVPMTVQNYMRSLHHFSEMPALSRWNSVGSSHSHPCAPKSVTEWLDFSEKDPVEILLDLGFGRDEPDICTKIPSRFISSASMATGINIRVFLEAQRQRMDVESPNLCGRFRQLEVLDHVTSAFSSLLSDINLMQQKAEDRNGDEKDVASAPKGKAVVSQTKRRRIGQLLRKASRQTVTHGPQAYRSTSSKIDEDDSSVADMDTRIAARTGLGENTTLDSLKEEMFPSEEEEGEAMTWPHPPQPAASKTQGLPHFPMKQTHFLSVSETPIKDRPRKEPHLLLNHMLKRVSGFNGKPLDSFEMEEIQSFEDESSWGNPLESTSDMIVTRTNSCQSDSSGFLEDPPEPFPSQALSLPGNLRLACNVHDHQTYLRHRKEAALTSQDFQPHAETSVAVTSTTSGGGVLPILSREQTFRGEEVFYSINEEDDLLETSRGQNEGASTETGHEVHEKEMQDQRGQLLEEDSCVENSISCHRINSMGQDDTSSPEGNWPSYSKEMHENAGSTAIEIRGTTPTILRNAQICVGSKEREGLLTEEKTGGVCRENEGVAEGVEGKRWDRKTCRKLDFPVPATNISVTNNCQDSCKLAIGLGSPGSSLDIALASESEHGDLAMQPEIKVISRSSLQDSRLSTHSLENGGIRPLDVLSSSPKPGKDECVPDFEASFSPFRSVTVQMPSTLMSNMPSFHLDEISVKGRSMDSMFKASQHSDDQPLLPPVFGAFKEEDQKVKDVSIQTERSHTRSRFLPSFHGHSRLVKSASLDTGLFGEYRPCCCKPFKAWCAQHRGHCCPFISHHCCLLQSFPLAPLCRSPVLFCSSNATLELQLLKTLKMLQDSAVRNISSCTVQEIEAMKNSCQTFRERLDEIEQHLIEQDILFSSAVSDEGRDERRRLQTLRQAVRREVAELECQLQDRARQVREGILMQLDQLLVEQSNLCSELGISNQKEEREPRSDHPLPDAAASPAFLCRAGGSQEIHHGPPSATVPPSPSTSLLRETDVLQDSPLPPGKPNPAADSTELHSSKKETKGPPQPKMDFKTFIQNLKKSFRSSFSNDVTDGKD